MTVEARIEFLMQSIESHDRQIGELVERMDKTTANIDALGGRVDALGGRVDALGEKVDRLVETTQLNFDRLTTAMMGLTNHVADHQRRIDRLER
jgi:ABC-type transporter Mla subunit MlaD